MGLDGCPMSPLLFAIAMDPLLSCARTGNLYHGMEVRGQTHFAALYADDLLLFLRDVGMDLPDSIDLLNYFGIVSGLHINWQKSHLFPLCRDVAQPLNLHGLNWSPTCIKYLGVKIYHNQHDLLDGSIRAAVRTLRTSINFWTSLAFSVAGRKAATKMVVLPKLLYLFNKLPLVDPRQLFRELESLLLKLFGGTGRRKVALTKLQSPVTERGLAAPDLESYYLAAQLQWLNR